LTITCQGASAEAGIESRVFGSTWETFGLLVPRWYGCRDYVPALPGRFEQLAALDEIHILVYISEIFCCSTIDVHDCPMVVKGNSHVAQSSGKTQGISHHLYSCPRTDSCLWASTSGFRFPIRIQYPKFFNLQSPPLQSCRRRERGRYHLASGSKSSFLALNRAGS
jgi:hypothetical protein